MTPLLQLSDVVVRREGRLVLNLQSLSVDRGEVLAVVGPNGAGKSTLFLVLSQLLNTHSGQIFFEGKPIHSLHQLEYRRRIALVLQEPLLLDTTVFENIALGLKFRGLPKAQIEARVRYWLERLGIVHLAERAARKLSGGEAQRVSLARAFILQPDLLLLDEPFTALDAPTRLRLLEDLRSVLFETRMTTIFITHDLQEARKLASRMAVLWDGHIVQIGSPAEIFHQPANRTVADFLGRAEYNQEGH